MSAITYQLQYFARVGGLGSEFWVLPHKRVNGTLLARSGVSGGAFDALGVVLGSYGVLQPGNRTAHARELAHRRVQRPPQWRAASALRGYDFEAAAALLTLDMRPAAAVLYLLGCLLLGSNMDRGWVEHSGLGL